MENAACSLNNFSVPFKYLLWLSLERRSTRSLALFKIFSTALKKKLLFLVSMGKSVVENIYSKSSTEQPKWKRALYGELQENPRPQSSSL